MACKAFEVKTLIENFSITDRIASKIECIESSGKNLFIGTNDGYVVHYCLDEKYTHDGTFAINCVKKNSKSLGNKKPILKMKSASALNHLFLLIDSSILVLNLNTLEESVLSKKFKSVFNFCLNENPSNYDPFSVQICLVKKRQLQICNITDADAIHIASVDTSETTIDLAMNGDFICTASKSMYNIYSWTSELLSLPLFPYSQEENKPIVKWIGQNEFLLNGPSQLGMFATTAGVSERPPIQWLEPTISFTFFHPYLLSCGGDFISIYSILDKQVKQTFPIKSCKSIGNFDGRIFVCSNSFVNVLYPIPWEKQVQTLMSAGHVQEAIDIAESSYKVGLSTEAAALIVDRFKQQGAFILLANESFNRASELFRESNVDVRELISLFPGMLPQDSEFHRSIPALHDIVDINHVSKGNLDKITTFKKFLMNYLKQVHDCSVQFKVEIETALIKLYCEIDLPQLYALLENFKNIIASEEDIKECLLSHQCHHALALYFKKMGHYENALEIWAKIITGDIQDKDFPGLEFFVKQVASVPDSQLIWKYSEFIMTKDQEKGVLIFMKTETQTNKKIDHDAVIKFLNNYETALLIYLEFIVIDMESQKEFHHTQLAVSYLKKIISSNEPLKYRKKLQAHLESSLLYNKPFLLQKLDGTELFMEKALLHGKSGKYELALKVLLEEAKDPSAAEEYCTRIAKNKDKQIKQKIFFELLKLYIKGTQGNKDEYLGAIISLLDNPEVELDPVSVNKILPDQWSLQLVSSFIRRSLEKCLHQRHMLKLETKLIERKLLNAKYIAYTRQKVPIVLDSSKYCCSCLKPFTSPQFALFPGGIQTHIECVRDEKVCPITGEVIVCKPHDILQDSVLI